MRSLGIVGAALAAALACSSESGGPIPVGNGSGGRAGGGTGGHGAGGNGGGGGSGGHAGASGSRGLGGSDGGVATGTGGSSTVDGGSDAGSVALAGSFTELGFRLTDLSTFPNGDLLATGITVNPSSPTSNTDANETVVMRMKRDGTPIWSRLSKSNDTDDSYFNAIAPDGTVVVGHYDFGFNGTPLANILTFDENGNPGWGRTFATPPNSEGSDFDDLLVDGTTIVAAGNYAYVYTGAFSNLLTDMVAYVQAVGLDGSPGFAMSMNRVGRDAAFLNIQKISTGYLVVGKVYSVASGADENILVAKLTAAGGIDWINEYATPGQDIGTAGAEIDGTLFVGGMHDGGWILLSLDENGAVKKSVTAVDFDLPSQNPARQIWGILPTAGGGIAVWGARDTGLVWWTDPTLRLGTAIYPVSNVTHWPSSCPSGTQNVIFAAANLGSRILFAGPIDGNAACHGGFLAEVEQGAMTCTSKNASLTVSDVTVDTIPITDGTTSALPIPKDYAVTFVPLTVDPPDAVCAN